MTEIAQTDLEENIQTIPLADLPDFYDAEVQDARPVTPRERAFLVMFYALSGLTAVLLVQVVWQVADFVARL